MIQRVKHIWSRTLTHRSEVFCIYICQLILGSLIGYITYSTINKYLGKSTALEHLASGFDRTVFMDIINNNDNVFSHVTSWAMFLIPLYLILSTLLQGGLLSNIKKGEIGIRSQLTNGVRYLPAFLGLALFSFILIALFIALIGLPFKAFVGDPLTTFSSEKPFVIFLLGLGALFSVFVITTWGFSISARYNYIEGASFGTSIKHGFLFVKENYVQILFLGILLIGIHLLLAAIYYLIMSDRGSPSWFIVILSVIIQQLFSLIRVFIRGFGYIAIDQIADEFVG